MARGRRVLIDYHGNMDAQISIFHYVFVTSYMREKVVGYSKFLTPFGKKMVDAENLPWRGFGSDFVPSTSERGVFVSLFSLKSFYFTFPISMTIGSGRRSNKKSEGAIRLISYLIKMIGHKL